jgi:hypothetical protein
VAFDLISIKLASRKAVVLLAIIANRIKIGVRLASGCVLEI